MKRYTLKQLKNKKIYIGIDIHIRTWHVTIRTFEVERCCKSIPGNWEAWSNLLKPYTRLKVQE